MPSPFPGIDPFIESSGYFAEFHGSLMVEIRNELNKRLPRGYAATLDLYVWIHEPEAKSRRRRVGPDVYVREGSSAARASSSSTIAAAPMQITLPTVERRKQKFVKIEDLETRRIVTVIEILSPANKDASKDRDAYLAKRNEYLGARVNLVEMDFLRRGQRLPFGEHDPAIKDYYVMVCKDWEHPRADFWTFGIRDPLSDIPIPVTKELPSAPLPLARCVAAVYDDARFHEKLRYDKPLSPRPRRTDVAWVRSRLASLSRNGRR
jgi:hypothetical protein